MTNYEILEHELFKIPFNRNDESIISFLKKKYADFFHICDTLNGEVKAQFDENKDFLNTFCENILISVDEYFKGFPSKSYNALAEGLELYVKKEPFHITKRKPSEKRIFYRARVRQKNDPFIFNRQQIFHRPFEERSKIETQRYSIAGLPSLYLSNNTYLCWEETGRPPIDSIRFSKFELDNSLKFLDLTYSIGFVSEIHKSSSIISKNEKLSDVFLLSALMKWPLVLACSIAVHNRESNFKPEYIIPQNLFQWIRSSKKVDGIKYITTKEMYAKVSPSNRLINCAIPVREISESGYCRFLTEKIKLTESLSFDQLEIMNYQPLKEERRNFEFKRDRADEIMGFLPFSTIEFANGVKQNYVDTKFGLIECMLEKMPSENLVLPYG